VANGIKTPAALTIAGSDPSGGAGIQADLKTFHQFGVYGEAAITLLTVQNTLGVERIECVDAGLVRDQIRAVIADIPPQAAKTGALGSRAIVEAVAEMARDFEFPLVVDPVILSGGGRPLLAPDAVEALKASLFPHAFLLMPNLDEAEALSGLEVRSVRAMREAAAKLRALGPRAVLVKGGHLAECPTDVLSYERGFEEFSSERIATRPTHGTGCTYAAAVAAGLAKGEDLVHAIRQAKGFVYDAIRTSCRLGAGSGPLNHHAAVPSSPERPAE
jgi:hydroxymethylpyrimidine/phosphomethylpyrimidine kinase